jgi:hypothetical protein
LNLAFFNKLHVFFGIVYDLTTRGPTADVIDNFFVVHVVRVGVKIDTIPTGDLFA